MDLFEAATRYAQLNHQAPKDNWAVYKMTHISGPNEYSYECWGASTQEMRGQFPTTWWIHPYQNEFNFKVSVFNLREILNEQTEPSELIESTRKCCGGGCNKKSATTTTDCADHVKTYMQLADARLKELLLLEQENTRLRAGNKT